MCKWDIFVPNVALPIITVSHCDCPTCTKEEGDRKLDVATSHLLLLLLLPLPNCCSKNDLLCLFLISSWHHASLYIYPIFSSKGWSTFSGSDTLWVFLLFLMNAMLLSQTAESTTGGSPVTAADAGQVNVDELVNPAVQNGKHSLVTSQTLHVKLSAALWQSYGHPEFSSHILTKESLLATDG